MIPKNTDRSPLVDPENDPKWKDCGLHVRTSMLIAAVVMLGLALVEFIFCFIAGSNFLHGIGVFLFVSAAILAVISLTNQSRFMTATMVVLSIRMVFSFVAIVVTSVELSSPGETTSQTLAANGSWLAFSIILAVLNVLFLVIGVKCMRYFDAKHQYEKAVSLVNSYQSCEENTQTTE